MKAVALGLLVLAAIVYVVATVAGPDGQAYKARQVVFQTEFMAAAGAAGANGSAGVRVSNVTEDQTPT